MVETGSKSRTWASPSATGRCSTPRGTIRNSPSRNGTVLSRNSMLKAPRTTRNISSSASCLCQMKPPWNLTSLTCWPFNSPTILGSQGAEKRESLSSRLTLSIRYTAARLPRDPLRDLLRQAPELQDHLVQALAGVAHVLVEVLVHERQRDGGAEFPRAAQQGLDHER